MGWAPPTDGHSSALTSSPGLQLPALGASTCTGCFLCTVNPLCCLLALATSSRGGAGGRGGFGGAGCSWKLGIIRHSPSGGIRSPWRWRSSGSFSLFRRSARARAREGGGGTKDSWPLDWMASITSWAPTSPPADGAGVVVVVVAVVEEIACSV